MSIENRLVPRLTGLKDRLMQIPQSLGVPQYRSVYIRKLQYEENSVFASRYDLKLETPCKANNVRPRLVGLPVDNNTILSYNDIELEISRTYNLEVIQNDVKYFIIDPEFDAQGRIISGIKCRLLYIDDSKLLYWGVILRLFSDDRTIEPLEGREIIVEPSGDNPSDTPPYLDPNSIPDESLIMGESDTPPKPTPTQEPQNEDPAPPQEEEPSSPPLDEPLLFEDTSGDFLYYGDY